MSAATAAEMFHHCASVGRLDCVGRLWHMREVQDIDWQDDTGLTALHHAVDSLHVHVVKFLLDQGASPNKRGPNSWTPLHFAAQRGHERIVGLLLASGADIEATDVHNFTPLMVATSEGFLSTVDKLLAHQANVNHTSIQGGSALFYASEKGHVEIVKSLLAHGASTESRHESGNTPLWKAVGIGHLHVAQLLIDYGADVNDRFPTAALIAEHRDYPNSVAELLFKADTVSDGRAPQTPTMLHHTAARGNVEMIDLLCRSGAHLNARAVEGRTPLHSAVPAHAKDAVLRLLGHGASASVVDNGGMTPFLMACLIGDAPVVVQMLRRLDKVGETATMRALVNEPRIVDKWTPLHAVADLGRLALVKVLVRHGAELETKNANGFSALHLATANGHDHVVAFLITNGANTETTDSSERTPLIRACTQGFASIVNLLLAHNANVNHKDINGSSALIFAAMHGRDKLLPELLKHTTDVNVRSNAGWTPLLVAAQFGYAKVARMLLNSGADVNSQGYDNWTPLTIAALNGHTDFCRLLVDRGASTNLQTTDGQTALHLAASRNHRTIIALLLAKHADPCVRDFHGHTPSYVALMNGYFETATRLGQLVGVNEVANNDHVWPRHSLLELYGVVDKNSGRVKTSRQNPPWYIDRASIKAVQNSEHLSAPGISVSVGTWLGANVMITHPTIITFEGYDRHQQFRLKQHFQKEVSKLYPLRHPHAIRLYGACHRDEDLYLVMERPRNGTFRSSLIKNKDRIWKIFHQTALGLQYLHERGIVHGKLMCDHILLGADGQAKLTGLGVYLTSLNSVLIDVWNSPQTTDPQNLLFDDALYARGRHHIQELADMVPYARPLTSNFTRVWDAPEVVLGQDPKVESDIYSLGMCVIEAVSGESPYAFEEFDKQDLQELIVDGVPPRRPAAFTDRGWELVLKMVCFEPLKRLKISEVVRELAAFRREEMEDNPRNFDSDFDEDADDAAAGVREIPVEEGNGNEETPQGQVHRRLHLAWQAANELPPEDCERVRSLLQEVFSRFANNMQTNPTEGQAALYAAQRQRADRVFAFHNEIDRVLDRHGSQLPSEPKRLGIHAWRDRWHKHRREQLQALGASLGRVSELDRESATCLLFELTRRRDAYTSIAPSDIDAACRAMRSMPGVRVPDWFIPHYEVEVTFDPSQQLGEGGCGSVHKGKWMGSRVAVKKVFDENDAAFEKEVEIWSQLYHPHVLQLFGACHVGEKSLVSEFAVRGRLNAYLSDLSGPKRNREVWRLLYETALGLQYLHAREIVHCDLKCDNILVSRDKKAKVSDYGLSRTTKSVANADRKASITSRWEAPEVLNGVTPTFASDVYSFGMVVVEAVTGDVPWFTTSSNGAVEDSVRRGVMFEMPKNFSDRQWALVVGACRFHPKERSPLSEIVAKLRVFADKARKSRDDNVKIPDELVAPEPVKRADSW